MVVPFLAQALGAIFLSSSAPEQLVMSGKLASFDISVCPSVHTLVQLPLPCSYVFSSDEALVSAALGIDNPRVLHVRASAQNPQGKASVSVQCSGGIVLLFLVHAQPACKTQLYEIKSEAIIEDVVTAMVEDKRREIEKQVRQSQKEDQLKEMITFFRCNNDTEESSKNLVYVRVFKQAQIGNEGFVLFSIKNRSSNVFRLQEVSAHNQEESLTNYSWRLSSPLVAPNAVENGVLRFSSASPHFGKVTLKVIGTERVIEVPKIDF